MAERARRRSLDKFLILGGGFATDRGMRKMAEPFGPMAIAYNSEISSDPKNPHRYRQQATFVDRATRIGRAVILPHSAGIQSWGETQDLLENRGFFDSRENTQRLFLIAASPVGLFRNVKEKAAFVVNYTRLIMSPTAKGIDALTAFPPELVTDAELQSFLSKWQQTNPTVETIAMPRQVNGRASLPLGSELARKLTENDIALENAVTSGNRRDVLRVIKQRGKIAKERIQQIFDGEDRPDHTATQVKVPFNTMVANALPILRRMFAGQAEADIRYLVEQGGEVVLVHFLYDKVASLKASLRLRDDLAKEGKHIKVVIFDRFGHTGLALDHEAYANGIKGLLTPQEQIL